MISMIAHGLGIWIYPHNKDVLTSSKKGKRQQFYRFRLLWLLWHRTFTVALCKRSLRDKLVALLLDNSGCKMGSRVWISGGFRNSLGRGTPTPKVDVKYYLANFFPKTAWNWKKWTSREGERMSCAPLRSANMNRFNLDNEEKNVLYYKKGSTDSTRSGRKSTILSDMAILCRLGL